MTRAPRAAALATTAAFVALLVPAVSHAGARASRFVQSDWNITSASGTQRLSMSGSDPGILDSFKANITTRWRTTTSRNHMLTFSWPTAKITSNFPDPRSFAVIDRTKVEMIGSASGVLEGAAGPTPFSCKGNTGKSLEGFSLNATHLGIGALVHPDPRVLFRDCSVSAGLNGLDALSSERIDPNKPTYTPIPISEVKTGHKGKKMTLTIKVSEPIKSSAGATVGTLVSNASLHLKFVAAI
jgi:hypothetical protein